MKHVAGTAVGMLGLDLGAEDVVEGTDQIEHGKTIAGGRC